jgi:organic hydroperoxide reductase OsmC/OhrA
MIMDNTFEVTLERQEGFQFEAEFGDDGETTLHMDEPEPLGAGSGPNAARVLAAAIANCLSASLLFCLEKSKIEVGDVKTRITGSIVPNAEGRLRLGPLKVQLDADIETVAPKRLDHCLEIFEDFCIVTASVRSGVDVEVVVNASIVPAAPVEAGWGLGQ